MQNERLIVRYIPVKNCYVYLANILTHRLRSQNAIEVSHKENIYYFSCFPFGNNYEAFYIGPTFARSLNIQEGDEIFVSSISNVPTLSSIYIAPCTTHDHELLELQREKVQTNLLNQVKIVAKDQPIVAWISKFSAVTFITVDLKPKSTYGVLEEFAEVHVLDEIANTTEATMKDVDKRTCKASSILTKILPYFSKEEDCDLIGVAAANRAFLQNYCKKALMPCVFRVHPLPDFNCPNLRNAYDMIFQCPYHILAPRDHLPKHITLNEDGKMMCKVKKVPERRHTDGSSTNTPKEDNSSSSFDSQQELVARIFVLNEIVCKSSPELWNKKIRDDYFDFESNHSCAYVSDSLRNALKLKIGSRIVVQIIEKDDQRDIRSKPMSIDIFSPDQSVTKKIFEYYVKAYSKHQPLLLNSYSTIILNGKQCFVQISPADCDYALINSDDLKNLTVNIQVMSKSSDIWRFDDTFKEDLKLNHVFAGCVKNILTECKIALRFSLRLAEEKDQFNFGRDNILICGGLGSGKTTICKLIIDFYRNDPYFVHTRMIDCRSLKGKKVETLQKHIMSIVYECVYYQPSIIFLDDLESITNASKDDEENTADAINAARITDMLINIFTEYQREHCIAIVATCVSVNKIGLKLRPARGAHFFRTILSTPNLEKTDRLEILQMAFKNKIRTSDCVNWNYYGNKTEGWTLQDLADLVEKAMFIAWKRHGGKGLDNDIWMTEKDIKDALENYTPISMQGVHLYKSDNHSWSDIGGLEDVKSSLIEILHWPLKYPEIFKNAPIKLQSGVLLYGMPGTGKTMLAKAIASECGVNLISIKGPELLSKYIGVSEESVREVFERAHRAKPCVLFFDEFDSLAPRRGHDNTGVTDRVVNQLLTQLDGIEDREGVAIVAASSRPDMLDPALLRPGRLDKCLHCPLPSEAEREVIFAALCNSQKIDTAKLDLKELAELSDGFTGADINAVITQARLSAFEEAMAIATDGKVDVADINVTQVHLQESLKATRPSLSKLEKKKYLDIYARFFKRGGNDVENIQKNQRATLA